MQKEDITAVWERFRTGKATKDDKALLESWYLHYEHEGTADLTDAELEYRLAAIRSNLPVLDEDSPDQAKVRHLWPRIAAAASIILALSVGGYFILHKSKTPNYAANNVKQDIKPGTNGAILTLANGQKVILEQAKAGKIISQNGADLRKAGDSLLVYQPGTAAENNAASYNTLETPKGKQYSVVLPDGSKVWLNAASSLKYPTAFTGNERKVELTGEAYFEVVHNNKQPFRVVTANQTIEDIGTYFNINAYQDEPVIKTTLLEGSIKISENGRSAILKPGEQAQIMVNSSKININLNADAEEAIAWKNGRTQFNNADIKSIMRMLSRWYNIDVVYQGNINESGFGGSVSRSKNISEVLKVLELTGELHFKIEGRKVTVMQ